MASLSLGITSIIPQGKRQVAPQLPIDPSIPSPLQKKTDTVARKSLASGPLPEHLFFASDVASVIKQGNQVTSTIEHRQAEVPSDIGFNASIFGVATGALTLSCGLLNRARGNEAEKQAYHKGDQVGAVAGFLRSSIRAPAEMMRGASTITTNSLTLANKTLPAAMLGLGIVTAVGSGLGSLAIGSTAILHMKQIYQYQKGLKGKQTIEEEYAYLKEILLLNQKDKEEVLVELFTPKKEAWYKKGAYYLADKLLGKPKSKEYQELKELLRKDPKDLAIVKQLLKGKNLGLEEVSVSEDPQLKALIEKAFPEYTQLSPEEKKVLLQLISQELEYKKQRKEAIFGRTVGGDVKQLIEASEKGENIDRSIIIASAKQHLCSAMHRMQWLLMACLLNLALTVITQVLTSGVYTLIELAMGALTSLIFLAIDGYYLYKAYKETHASWKERALMLLTTLGVVIAGALAGALARSTAIQLAITAILLCGCLLLSLVQVLSWQGRAKKEASSKEGGLMPDLGNLFQGNEEIKIVSTSS